MKLQCLYDNLMSNNFPRMTVKSFLKDRLLNVFKLLESYIFFLAMKGHNNRCCLNCKTLFMRDQSSVACNALWDLAQNSNVFEISYTPAPASFLVQ